MLQGMIPFWFPGIARVRCAFGTREYGSVALASGPGRPAAEQCRRRLVSLSGVEGFAEAKQVHGMRIWYEPCVQDPGLEPEEEADGLACSRGGLALMIKTADCQPILVAHEDGKHIMALHCGWRGNRMEFPYFAVQDFCAHYGLDPGDLWAVRGPSLGSAAAEFVHFKQEWGDGYLPWYRERARTMDLWSLTRSQLTRTGMRPERILGLDLCTFEGYEMFFSYRHARAFGSVDGRQASLIWITQK